MFLIFAAHIEVLDPCLCLPRLFGVGLEIDDFKPVFFILFFMSLWRVKMNGDC